MIYRDFFQFQGPVFYYVYAGLFAFTGPSIAAARALNILITAFSATLIGLLVRRSLGPLAGAVTAVVHACLLVPMYPYTSPHWLAEAFVFMGIYLLVTGRSRANREVAAGASLGLSAFTVQSLGLPVLVGSILALAITGVAQRSWKESLIRAFRLFVGALLSIFPFIIYLGVVGALDQMWYGTVEWVFNHYPQGQTDAMTQGYGAYLAAFLALHKSVGQPWRGLGTIGLHIVKFLPVFTIFGAIVAGVRVIVNKWRQRFDYGDLVIGSAAVAATAPLLLGITRVDIVHIAFLGSFGLWGAATAFQSLVNWKLRFHFPVLSIWIVVGILVITNFSGKAVMTYRPSRQMQGWRGEILKLGLGRWIDTNLGPNERIVTAFGGLSYLYIRRSAVGFTFLPFGTPGYYSDEQWRKLGIQILKTLPPVVEVTQEQWLQVTQRTPELARRYQLYNIQDRYILLREGFAPHK